MTDGSLFNLDAIERNIFDAEESATDNRDGTSTRFRRPPLYVMANDLTRKCPCAICGDVDTPDGFDVFVDGTTDFVCDRCGWHFEPRLMRACNEARNAIHNLKRELNHPAR